MLHVIGDPFYSSLAHLVRVIRLFEICKNINPCIKTHLFIYEGDAVGSQIKGLIDTALESGIIDVTVPVPVQAGKHFDMLRAKTWISYVTQNKSMFVQELKHKGKYINRVASSAKQVMVLSSPGFFGSWYTPPFISTRVKDILILDTIYHPNAEVHIGTAWNKKSLRGRLQEWWLQIGFYRPFRNTLNQIREELGLPLYQTRQSPFQNALIIDPNVPSYTRLNNLPKNHYQIGTLVLGKKPNINRSELLQNLNVFKGEYKLVYITLGGSVKSTNFSAFINTIVTTMLKQMNGNVRFLITTGSTVTIEEVVTQLGPRNTYCLVHRFYDAGLAMSAANVAIGIMGQGHVLLAAQHGCPLVMCPINADQVTHANLVSRLGLGINPLRVSLNNLFNLECLINSVLNNAQTLAHAALKLLSEAKSFHNSQVQAELLAYDDGYQNEIVRSIFTTHGFTTNYSKLCENKIPLAIAQ